MSTVTPPTASLDSIIAQLQETSLVPPEQLAPFIPPAAAPADAATLTNRLVDRGLLTKFQASQVAAGKAKSLVIGAYAMLDRVTGGGGLLFKGLQRRMQRVVFIKPLPPSLMKTASARVQRDVAAAGRFSHPNLVAVQDLDEVGGAHFLVTEFVDGADLATVAQQGKFAIDKACGLVAQAAEALVYLHSQGAVHRDVKIENLFIERGGAVKLFGLGVASAETGDAPGDVLGLGRVLYRLVAGVDLPVGAIPALKAARPEVSPALEKFCLRMVSPAPTERPSAAEVAAAMKSPELTAPVPVVDNSQSMFPELFVNAEEEASTVMSAPFDPATLPPMNPPTAPGATPQPAAAAAPVPVEMSGPAAFSPAATAPAAAPSDPAPFAPAAMMPAAEAASPVPEFSINTAPAAADVSEPEAVVASAGEDDEELAVATIEATPSDGAFAATSSFSSTTTTTTASKATKKAAKPTKPIELPFNLQLDPKYLEPKYVAGAAGGFILLFTLLLWGLTGGSKQSPVKPVPAIPVSRAPKPLSPADVTPGMFNLPSSDSLSTNKKAPYGEKPVFDEFGFQVPGSAPTATKPRR